MAQFEGGYQRWYEIQARMILTDFFRFLETEEALPLSGVRALLEDREKVMASFLAWVANDDSLEGAP